MNGAPAIAPMPTSCEPALLENKIANIGMIVSGRAVPMAARMLPTMP